MCFLADFSRKLAHLLRNRDWACIFNIRNMFEHIHHIFIGAFLLRSAKNVLLAHRVIQSSQELLNLDGIWNRFLMTGMCLPFGRLMFSHGYVPFNSIADWSL